MNAPRQCAVALAISLAACAQSPAHAVALGARWEPVPNATNPVTSESTGLDGLWMTFDLYVDFEPGDQIAAADFGIAGPNIGLTTDGEFYQVHPPYGSDSAVQNLSMADSHPTIAFDTAVAMNDESLLFAVPMTWNEAGVTGAWYSSEMSVVDGPVWVARITVNTGTSYLGGQVFASLADGCGQIPAVCVVNVPNALPAPGTASILIAALLASNRRRRYESMWVSS